MRTNLSGRKGTWPFRVLSIAMGGLYARYIDTGVFVHCLSGLSLAEF
jgi:hypothetical protein